MKIGRKILDKILANPTIYKKSNTTQPRGLSWESKTSLIFKNQYNSLYLQPKKRNMWYINRCKKRFAKYKIHS